MTQLDECRSVGCETPGGLPRCKLCAHSPDYWRKTKKDKEAGK